MPDGSTGAVVFNRPFHSHFATPPAPRGDSGAWGQRRSCGLPHVPCPPFPLLQGSGGGLASPHCKLWGNGFHNLAAGLQSTGLVLLSIEAHTANVGASPGAASTGETSAEVADLPTGRSCSGFFSFPSPLPFFSPCVGGSFIMTWSRWIGSACPIPSSTPWYLSVQTGRKQADILRNRKLCADLDVIPVLSLLPLFLFLSPCSLTGQSSSL